MHIAHLAATEALGGAARAAQRLHRSLRDLGLRSEMHVGLKSSDDPDVHGPPLTWWTKKRQGLYRRLDALPCLFLSTPNRSQLSPAWIGAARPDWHRLNQADLVHLHWIGGGFLRLERLRRLRRPVVWRLADMWPLAGAEHYTDGCDRFARGYLPGDRPPGETGLDVNRWVWSRKRRVFADLDLTLVAPSRWLADCARRSVLFRDRPVHVIPTGQDVDRFRPLDAAARRAARTALGLPPDAPLVGFGAMNATSDPRKGFLHLQNALDRLAGTGIEAVVFGNKETPAGLPVPVHAFGNIDDPDTLARLYAACDVFAAPSREENLANTVIEAMACGTPVAAFAVGGMLDIVHHETDGWLAPPFDEDALAAGLHRLCTSPDFRRRCAAAARATVLAAHTLDHQARAYRDLYARILHRPHPLAA